MLADPLDRGRRRVDRLINESLSGQLQVGPRSAGRSPARPATSRAAPSRPSPTPTWCSATSPRTLLRRPDALDKRRPSVRSGDDRRPARHLVEAAALIRRIVDHNMNSAIKREIHLRGYHPEDFAMFAFGGAGPTHVSGFLGDLAGAVIFPTAPVFCAMGSSIMDIVHVYETSRRMIVMAPMTQALTTEYGVFNGVVDALAEQARADLAAEGLPADRAAVHPRAGHALRRAGQREAHRLPGAAPAPPRATSRRCLRRVRAGVLRGVQPPGRSTSPAVSTWTTSC